MKENYYSSISLFPSIEKGFLSQRRKKTLHICYPMRLVNVSNVSINTRGNFLAVPVSRLDIEHRERNAFDYNYNRTPPRPCIIGVE